MDLSICIALNKISYEKKKMLKIGLRSDLRWPKLGLEPKFHDPGTFGGFGKCEQSFIRYPADI